MMGNQNFVLVGASASRKTAGIDIKANENVTKSIVFFFFGVVKNQKPVFETQNHGSKTQFRRSNHQNSFNIPPAKF